MDIKEGTCWDEHWMLYRNQFDNKFHIKKNKIKHFLMTATKREPIGKGVWEMQFADSQKQEFRTKYGRASVQPRGNK